MQTEQALEEARVTGRLSQMTAFLNSPYFVRITAIQREIGTVKFSEGLTIILNHFDLSEESEYSPIRDLWFLLLAELVFVQMRYPARTQDISTADSLEQLGEYAELRKSTVNDPGMWVQYKMLAGMQALLDDRASESLEHLSEFETFTKPFGLARDLNYAAKMREYVSANWLNEAKDLLGETMPELFREYFHEVSQAIDRKLAGFRGQLSQ